MGIFAKSNARRTRCYRMAHERQMPTQEETHLEAAGGAFLAKASILLLGKATAVAPTFSLDVS